MLTCTMLRAQSLPLYAHKAYMHSSSAQPNCLFFFLLHIFPHFFHQLRAQRAAPRQAVCALWQHEQQRCAAELQHREETSTVISPLSKLLLIRFAPKAQNCVKHGAITLWQFYSSFPIRTKPQNKEGRVWAVIQYPAGSGSFPMANPAIKLLHLYWRCGNDYLFS